VRRGRKAYGPRMSTGGSRVAEQSSGQRTVPPSVASKALDEVSCQHLFLSPTSDSRFRVLGGRNSLVLFRGLFEMRDVELIAAYQAA
jgi:hypothetical protein